MGGHLLYSFYNLLALSPMLMTLRLKGFVEYCWL